MSTRIEIDKMYQDSVYIEARQYIKNYVSKFVEDNKRNPSCFIKTYGCQMNENDSEQIRWIMEELGFDEAENEKSAEYIIYNTCLIRENAELKVYGRVGALKSLKRGRPEVKIIICGCMMQNEEIRNVILEKYRHVDIIFGTNTIQELPRLIYTNLITGKATTDVLDNKDLLVENIQSARKYDFKAYVNIMYGCNNFCTYCVVPYTRGREISRMPDDVLKQVEELAKNGVKEITLLGQNVNSYGKNFEDDYRFYNLLEDLNNIDGLKRIRFMTSHPKDMPDELINCYGRLEKLSPYIHLPVQSGSNQILKAMNRHYTIEDYITIVDKIRLRVPDIAISTDIIVGFPGETEEDFQKTLDLVKKVEFDSCFSFIYSSRPGTKAAEMVNHISEDIKKERLERLNNTLNEISLIKNEAYMKKNVEILVEEQSKTDKSMLTGRTDTNKLVHFKTDKDVIGKFVKVNINNVKTFSLEGDFIEVIA